MKRLLLTAATLLSCLMPLAARADDCAPVRYYQPCIADAHGNTVCATAPNSACMIDGNGNAVCGQNCQIGGNGVGFCM